MSTCSICGNENLEGALICAQCGASLADQPLGIETQPFALEADEEELIHKPGGSAEFQAKGKVNISIQGMEPIIVQPDPDIILGREDKIHPTSLDVDLTPYAAYRMGVSRQHAKLRAEEGHLYLVDLESSNGTLLNGQRLVAHQPYVLHDGDEVCLGRMVMRIYFD